MTSSLFRPTNRNLVRHVPLKRRISQSSSYSSMSSGVSEKAATPRPTGNMAISKSDNPLSVMPTGILLRSIVMTSVMSSPLLFRPCLALLRKLTESKSLLFDETRNPILKALLRHTVYAHFNAGIDKQEVIKTVKELKRIGFKGVNLGYGREIVLGTNHGQQNTVAQGQNNLQMVEEWKQGTLQTLEMIGPGDFTAIKFTGAGPIAMEAMLKGQAMPKPISDAINEVCESAARQGVRIWIDAEQQAIQHTIDSWTIDLMRKYNRDRAPLVYNTIQGYLKGARDNATRHIKLAATEGWNLGVKLVRGAYIEHEDRSLIHDTKEDTDRSYNDIASALIEQRLPASEALDKYPQVALFLASHNIDSVRNAMRIYRQRVESGQPTIILEVGQLQGMADEVSYELLQVDREWSAANSGAATTKPIPMAYKSLVWGTVAECVHFLYRRAIENRGAATRTKHMAQALRQELRRRVFG